MLDSINVGDVQQLTSATSIPYIGSRDRVKLTSTASKRNPGTAYQLESNLGLTYRVLINVNLILDPCLKKKAILGTTIEMDHKILICTRK